VGTRQGWVRFGWSNLRDDKFGFGGLSWGKIWVFCLGKIGLVI